MGGEEEEEVEEGLLLSTGEVERERARVGYGDGGDDMVTFDAVDAVDGDPPVLFAEAAFMANSSSGESTRRLVVEKERGGVDNEELNKTHTHTDMSSTNASSE